VHSKGAPGAKDKTKWASDLRSQATHEVHRNTPGHPITTSCQICPATKFRRRTYQNLPPWRATRNLGPRDTCKNVPARPPPPPPLVGDMHKPLLVSTTCKSRRSPIPRPPLARATRKKPLQSVSGNLHTCKNCYSPPLPHHTTRQNCWWGIPVFGRRVDHWRLAKSTTFLGSGGVGQRASHGWPDSALRPPT
jgi:hypothetical protein